MPCYGLFHYYHQIASFKMFSRFAFLFFCFDLGSTFGLNNFQTCHYPIVPMHVVKAFKERTQGTYHDDITRLLMVTLFTSNEPDIVKHTGSFKVFKILVIQGDRKFNSIFSCSKRITFS